MRLTISPQVRYIIYMNGNHAKEIVLFAMTMNIVCNYMNYRRYNCTQYVNKLLVYRFSSASRMAAELF